jgi:hypothetical protein
LGRPSGPVPSSLLYLPGCQNLIKFPVHLLRGSPSSAPACSPPSPHKSLLFPEPYLNPERQRPKRKDPPPVLSCLSSRTRTRTRTAGCTCRRIVASQSRLNKTHPNLSIPSPKKGAQPKVKEGSRCTCAVVASFASLRTRAFLVVNPSVHPPTHLLRRVHAPGLRRRTLGERR